MYEANDGVARHHLTARALSCCSRIVNFSPFSFPDVLSGDEQKSIDIISWQFRIYSNNSSAYCFQKKLSLLSTLKMSQNFSCLASPASRNEDRTETTVPRVTTAEVSLAFSPLANASSDQDAHVEANTTTPYQMTYLQGGNASFVFTETITAKSFLGNEGTFIVQGKGTFDAKKYVVKVDFDVVKGTGTGGLEGTAGKGSFGPPEEGSKQLLYKFVLYPQT